MLDPPTRHKQGAVDVSLQSSKTQSGPSTKRRTSSRLGREKCVNRTLCSKVPHPRKTVEALQVYLAPITLSLAIAIKLPLLLTLRPSTCERTQMPQRQFRTFYRQKMCSHRQSNLLRLSLRIWHPGKPFRTPLCRDLLTARWETDSRKESSSIAQIMTICLAKSSTKFTKNEIRSC